MKKVVLIVTVVSFLFSCAENKTVKEKTNAKKITGYWIGHEKGADVTLDIKAQQVVEMRYIKLNPYSDTTVTGTYTFKESDTELILNFGATLQIHEDIIVLTDTEMTLKEHEGKATTKYRKQIDK
jgi:hypothetical protein